MCEATYKVAHCPETLKYQEAVLDSDEYRLLRILLLFGSITYLLFVFVSCVWIVVQDNCNTDLLFALSYLAVSQTLSELSIQRTAPSGYIFILQHALAVSILAWYLFPIFHDNLQFVTYFLLFLISILHTLVTMSLYFQKVRSLRRIDASSKYDEEHVNGEEMRQILASEQ